MNEENIKRDLFSVAALFAIMFGGATGIAGIATTLVLIADVWRLPLYHEGITETFRWESRLFLASESTILVIGGVFLVYACLVAIRSVLKS